ncbi:methyltransferase [Photorhabdus heterorhabditis]|uniref:Methyltransferase n=1 Tax=Photorhabdus heterorhabditis TaxID=880156 RepID=A0ABR5KC89_9GAMM|nr:methyltransferase [Photorhabdus heterorhabditis]KOY62121.1 methyltransferase [Photorhabdus heterorhabditis]MBS9443990.1 methyltransferase [Photorhabdus heterorhabditis]
MITELITSYRKSAAIYAFVDTGLSFNFKDNTYISISELSYKYGIDRSRLSRLCDFLIEIGVLVNSSLGVKLSDACRSLADPESLESLWIKCELGSAYWKSWLMYSNSLLKNDGKSAFEKTHDQSFFEYLENNELLKSNFDTLMSRITDEIIHELVDIYDFNKNNRILDIGGGKGNLLKGISKKVIGKHYAVLDKYKEIPASENINFISGDFLKSIPSGYDLYILKNIIHDWPDNDAILILKNCRKVMDKRSTLLLIDSIKTPQSPIGKSLDILMDILFLGQERYLSEFEHLANQAGLVIKKTENMSVSKSIIILEANNEL